MVTGRKSRGTVKRWLKEKWDLGLGRQMVETGSKKIGTVRAEEGGLHEEMVTITEIKGGIGS